MLERHGLTLPPETEPLRGLGPGRAAELAPQGPARHPPGAVPPKPAAPGAAAAHPGPVVAVGVDCSGAVSSGCSIVAPFLLHHCCLGAIDPAGEGRNRPNPLAVDLAGAGYLMALSGFFQRFPP